MFHRAPTSLVRHFLTSPRVRRFMVLSGFGFSLAAGAAMAGDAPAYQRIYDDWGTVRFPAVSIPQSDFVSPGFKRAYVNHLRAAEALPPPPPMDAPKADWDEYAVEFDKYVTNADGGHDWIVAHYPADIAKGKMGDVPVEIIVPKSGIAPGNENRVLINVHGGGFFAGGGGMTGESESIPIAVLGRIKVVTVDYRMAPANLFPAASEDVESVYRELLKTYQPTAIGIYGCSAGGTLAAQAIVWLQSKGLPRPGAVGMFCAAPTPPGKLGDQAVWGINGLPPVPGAPFSLTCGRQGCALQPAKSATPGANRPQQSGYMSTADPKDPRAYPGVSDEALARFPPALLLTGTRAVDASASIAAHAKFLQLGVDSQLYLQDGGWHGFHFLSAFSTPEGIAANKYIYQFFDKHLSR